MLTAEIKINKKAVAVIEARNVKTVSDKPGDFIGDRKTVCEYECAVNRYINGNWEFDDSGLTITHDRRFGWAGLLNKITSEVIPQVVETMSEDDLVGVCRNCKSWIKSSCNDGCGNCSEGIDIHGDGTTVYFGCVLWEKKSTA